MLVNTQDSRGLRLMRRTGSNVCGQHCHLNTFVDGHVPVGIPRVGVVVAAVGAVPGVHDDGVQRVDAVFRVGGGGVFVLRQKKWKISKPVIPQLPILVSSNG